MEHHAAVAREQTLSASLLAAAQEEFEAVLYLNTAGMGLPLAGP